MTREPPSLMDRIQEQLDPVNAAKLKGLELFQELKASIGDAEARRIFAIWGTPPSDSRLNEIESMGIIDRLDIQHGGNVKALARQIAAAKFVNPSTDEIASVERQIR